MMFVFAFKWWRLYVFNACALLCFGCGAVGVQSTDYQHFSKTDFYLIQSLFSGGRCNNSLFLSRVRLSGLDLKFLDLGDAGAEVSIDSLSKDDLCLIELGTSFQAFRRRKIEAANGVYSKVGVLDKFDEGMRVARIEFFLPKTLAPKRCYSKDQDPYPFVLYFVKKSGRITGRIFETDTSPECFALEARKKGRM